MPGWLRAKGLRLTLSSHFFPRRRTWDDIYDVFGNGDEYDWALEGEDEMFGAAGDGEAPKISDVRASLATSVLCSTALLT